MKKLTFLMLACLFTLVASAQIYVKPAADGGADANDGRSWATAKATVAAAIPEAFKATVKEVWVKKGTYTDVWGTNWKSATDANGINGVAIYGGFNGDETALKNRVKGAKPWEYTNETVISFSLASGNAFAVATLPANGAVVVDGFSFKGMTNSKNGSISFRDNVTFQNCIWANNTMDGTLINPYVTGTSGPGSIINCLFENNNINKNNVLSVNPTVGSAVIDGCVFVGNTASHRIINLTPGATGKALLANSIFYNNQVNSSGGDVINTSATAQVVNCLLYNNKVSKNVILATGTIVNSTIVNNKGEGDTNGGISLVAGGKIYNSIVRGNVTAKDEAVALYPNVAAEVKNCALSVALGSSVIAENNYLYGDNATTGFVKPSTFAGLDKDKTTELAGANWQLTNQPHAMINGGDKTLLDAAYTKDLAGAIRVQNDKIDLGAYESAYTAPTLPTLTITPGTEGNMTSVAKNGSYFMGQGIDITAAPVRGKKVTKWTNQAGVTVAETKNFTFVMPEVNTTLTAEFVAAAPRTLILVAGNNGSASVNKAGTYYADEVISLIATPNADYKFINWSDNTGKVVSTEANFDFTMPDNDVTLTASFKYKLTRYLISEKDEDAGEGGILEKMKWGRVAGPGETIIDLNDPAYNLSFEEFIKDGTKWPAPLTEGDEVWLLGDYHTVYNGVEFVDAGVKWYGGFAGTETSPDQRSLIDIDENGIVEPWEFEYQTIFDGRMQDLGTNGTVLLIDEGAIVDGVVIQGGRQGAVERGAGVGIGNNGGTKCAVLRNSVVRRNVVTGATASAYVCGAVVESNSLMEYCLVEENEFDATNTGATYGAGVVAPRAGAVVANCVIRNNKNYGSSGGNNHGGGAKITGGVIRNCLIYNNTAGRGAGLYLDGTGIAEYCTVVNNKSANYKAEDTSSSGGGVYFRGSGAVGASYLKNSVVWNNEAPDAIKANIFIETDKRATKNAGLGAVAFNGGSDLKDGEGVLYYTALDGNTKMVSDLGTTDIFQNASTIIGYNEAQSWAYDWRPKSDKLKIAVQLQEDDEFDILNFKRTFPSAVGAYEFGSVITGIESPLRQPTASASVYCVDGKLHVLNATPVAVEIYSVSGMKQAVAPAATNHAFVLPKGLYIVVLKDGSSRTTTKAMLY